MIGEWMQAHASDLDSLRAIRIDDDDFGEHLEQFVALYDDIQSLRQPELHNWSEACASKTLGQLAPAGFVIWDSNIKVYAAGDYRLFLAEMNGLALRLIEQSPAADGPALDAFLQEHLRYKIRKPLAKYLDEYNWHVAVGRGYRRRR